MSASQDQLFAIPLREFLKGFSLARLTELADAIPYRVYLKDTASRFVYANRATLKLFGLGSPTEVFRKTDVDFFVPEFADQFRRDDLQVINSGEPIIDKLEEEHLRPNDVHRLGRRFWVLTTTLPLRDSQGEIVGIFGVSKDVTEPQQLLDRYQWALDRTSDGLWYRDLRVEDHSMWTSTCWKRMLGFEEDREVRYSDFLQLVHPDDVEKYQTTLNAHLEGQTEAYHCDFRLKHRNGNWVWVRARGKARFDSDGQPIDFAGAQTAMSEADRHAKQLLTVINAVKNTFFFIKDEDGRFVLVNQAVADAYGTARENCIGKTDIELSRSPAQLQQAERFRAVDNELLRAIRPYRATVWEDDEQFVDATSAVRYLHTLKERVVLTGDGPQLVGFSLDITELMEARHTLWQLIDASSDAIYIKDTEGRFRRINRRMAQIVGLEDPTDAVGKTHGELFDAFDPEHARLAEEDEQRIIDNGERHVINERWATCADGRRFYSYTLKEPLFVGDKPTGVLAVSRDMTELKNQEQLFRAVYNTLSECVFIKDRNSVIIECNRSFREWHKDALGIDDPVGMTDYELWPNNPEQAEHFRRVDRQVMETGNASGPIKEEQVFPDGRKRLLITEKFPRFDDKGRVIGLFGIFRDVTEEVKRQRDEFYQDMARTVGHCLGTWMGTLEANCKLLAKDFASTPALERLREAIGFLRHFAKIAGGFATIERNIRFNEVSIPRLLERCVALVADIRVRLRAETPGLVVVASEFHLQLAVSELLNNAKRFAHSRIEVWHECDNEHYEIHVRDDGRGVVDRLVRRDAMFDPGTTSEEASHTGLGLAYVKRVAEIHRGKVEYVRSPNQGAHFAIRLPRRPTEEEL